MPNPTTRHSSRSSGSQVSSLIDLQTVTKTYTRGRLPVHAVRDISLQIPEGEFLCVAGPSGSGKSTLLHLIAALDRPSRGTIKVGNWTLSNLDSSQRAQYRRSMVGLVFQEFHLVPTMTSLENVALPLVLSGVDRETRRARATRTLESVGLGDRSDHRPGELSGGEQQRVAAARALIGDPPLVMADEPTGNLDRETGDQIIDLLTRLHRKQGRTVIVVTHHIEQIENAAERVVHLRDGALVETG